jgi:phosphate starvation-inducible PhoH-like protein
VDVLTAVEGISFIYFNEKDVVRHDLVQRIIRAYERYQNHKLEPAEPKQSAAGEAS